MAFGYPISLDVTDRLAVVIGRDAVAMGKVDALLAAGARVTVIAEGPGTRLDAFESDLNVIVERRGYQPGDLEDAFLCVASSSDPDERQLIFAEARDLGVLVNVMDDVPHCDFAAPAVVRRGELTIAISTGGGSPALARRLREQLETQFGEEWGDVLEVLRNVRSETLDRLPNLEERSSRWARALDTAELTGLVKAGRVDEARSLLTERLLQGETA